MKILKITRSETSVRFRHEVQGHKAIEERDITAHEAPLKTFDDCLQSLSDVACNVMELGSEYKKGMKVTSVAFSYTKKGTRSAVVSFTKEMDATGSAHPMSTPCFQFDDAAEGEDGQRRQCSKKHAELLAKMIVETENYANGERQQRLLPLDDGKSENAEPQGGDVLKFSTPPAGDDGQGPKASETPAAPAAEQPKKRKRAAK